MISHIVYFGQILIVLCAGIILGWFYCRKFIVAPLRAQNESLRKIDIRELDTKDGVVFARTTEWPMNAEEYLELHSIERDGGTIEITYVGMENHLNTFARHLLTRQKKDFMRICRNIKNGDKVMEQINGNT